MTHPRYPIPHDGFHQNPGAFPDKLPLDTELFVQWGNGHIDWDRTYTPTQLRWNLTRHPWDVAAVKPAVAHKAQKDGRQANGSYE